MPTIKRKVEMNLPQFIAWAVDNHITGSFYANNRVNAKRIRFEFGRVVSSHGELRSHDTFTVEIEEPVTEDTVFDNLIEINELIDFKKEGLLGGVRLYKNSSINQVENDKSVAYYIMNDDLEMTLIWKRKEGLVE